MCVSVTDEFICILSEEAGSDLTDVHTGLDGDFVI